MSFVTAEMNDVDLHTNMYLQSNADCASLLASTGIITCWSEAEPLSPLSQ